MCLQQRGSERLDETPVLLFIIAANIERYFASVCVSVSFVSVGLDVCFRNSFLRQISSCGMEQANLI